jgi:tetratricopeptide (TPR) repeat protein
MRRLLGLWLALASLGCTPTLSQPRGDAHLTAMAQARRHYHHGRMEEAADAYGEAATFAERRVDRDEALYRQAKALTRAERFEEALTILDEVAQRRPESRRTVRALLDGSLLRIRMGRRAPGFLGLRRLVRQHPDSGVASHALREILRGVAERGDNEATLRLIHTFYEHVGHTAIGDDLLAAEVDLLEARGERDGVRALLLRILEEHPYPRGQRWDDALWQLAEMDEADGNYREAIGWLERMLSVHETTNPPGSYTLPRQPAAQLRIARIYRDRLQDYGAAADAFEATYDRFETSTLRDDALVELGEMQLDRGDREDGCDNLRRAVEEFEVGRARRRAARRVERSCRD